MTQLGRHMEIVAKSFEDEERNTAQRRKAVATEFVDDLFFNMRERFRKRGIKKPFNAEALHMQFFDETFKDVSHSSDGKDLKVRVFFEPLILIVKGDKQQLLPIMDKALERYFPVPKELGMEWRTTWKQVPFKPKRRGDTRTSRLTVQFKWARIKRPVELVQKVEGVAAKKTA